MLVGVATPCSRRLGRAKLLFLFLFRRSDYRVAEPLQVVNRGLSSVRQRDQMKLRYRNLTFFHAHPLKDQTKNEIGPCGSIWLDYTISKIMSNHGATAMIPHIE